MERQYGLDYLRAFAIILVIIAHFTFTAHHRIDIIGINNSIPILADKNWIFLLPDFYLGTYLGTLGVTIFFLTTGYLIPPMLNKYSRKEFIMNRFFRIMPTLIISMAICFIIGVYFNNVNFNLIQLIYSCLLIYQWTDYQPISPVLWTLVIEIVFYGIIFFVGKLTKIKLYILMILTLIFLNINFNQNITEILRHIPIIFTGMLVYALEKFIISKIEFFLFFFGMLLLWRFNNLSTPYSSVSTVVLSIFIFGLFYFIFKNLKIKLMINLSNLVYPLYLIHFTLGLTCMKILSNLTINQNFIFIFSILVTILSGYILHVMIEKPSISYFKRKYIKGLI